MEKEAHDLIAAKHTIISRRRWNDDMDDLHEFAHVPEKMDEESEDGRVQYQREGFQQRKEERQQRIAERQDLMDVDPADAIQEQGLWSDDELEQDWSVQHEEKLGKHEMMGMILLNWNLSGCVYRKHTRQQNACHVGRCW